MKKIKRMLALVLGLTLAVTSLGTSRVEAKPTCGAHMSSNYRAIVATLSGVDAGLAYKTVATGTQYGIASSSPLAYSSTVSSSGSGTLQQIHTAKDNYWFNGSVITVTFYEQSGSGWSYITDTRVSKQ